MPGPSEEPSRGDYDRCLLSGSVRAAPLARTQSRGLRTAAAFRRADDFGLLERRVLFFIFFIDDRSERDLHRDDHGNRYRDIVDYPFDIGDVDD